MIRILPRTSPATQNYIAYCTAIVEAGRQWRRALPHASISPCIIAGVTDKMSLSRFQHDFEMMAAMLPRRQYYDQGDDASARAIFLFRRGSLEARIGMRTAQSYGRRSPAAVSSSLTADAMNLMIGQSLAPIYFRRESIFI